MFTLYVLTDEVNDQRLATMANPFTELKPNNYTVTLAELV